FGGQFSFRRHPAYTPTVLFLGAYPPHFSGSTRAPGIACPQFSAYRLRRRRRGYHPPSIPAERPGVGVAT
ncbi:hypothetical protein, partial [uncultured Corynebacterium sp.]|uniref:hypothetical protein n=1 Tax=uncultured Corynebacterium sp. TaxID=159447 RepID=UPI0025D0D52F